MKTILLNDRKYQVDDRFEDFTFHKKPSSNVYAFGFRKPSYQKDYDVVVQFNNGGSYFYTNVPSQTIHGAVQAESIGRFYRAEISGKHVGKKLTSPVLTPVIDAP